MRARSIGRSSTYAALTGLALAGLWLDTRRRVRRAERRNPPLGRFVDTECGRMHYLERGRGPAVVLVHGAGIMLQDFTSSVFSDVAERYHAVAFDRPGYGYSERTGCPATPMEQAELLHGAIRALGLERPVLVGHSYGGPVALAYADQYPREVAGVVFMAGMAFPKPRFDLLPFFVPAIPVAGPLLRHTVLQPLFRLLLPGMLRRIFAPNPVPRRFLQTISRDLVLRPAQLEADAQDLMALVPSLAELVPAYPRMRVPVAILAGEEDRIVSVRHHAVPLSEALPDATLTLLPGVGHMLHHFRPEVVMAAIEDVLRRSRSTPGYRRDAGARPDARRRPDRMLPPIATGIGQEPNG